MTRGCNFAFD